MLLIGKKELVQKNDSETTWKLSQTYLQEQTAKDGLSILLLQYVGKFLADRFGNIIFTEECTFALNKYVGDKIGKLDMSLYGQSPIACLIVPIVKEAITFAGIANPTPVQKYLQAQYIFDTYSDMKDKIASFSSKLKLTIY